MTKIKVTLSDVIAETDPNDPQSVRGFAACVALDELEHLIEVGQLDDRTENKLWVIVDSFLNGLKAKRESQ